MFHRRHHTPRGNVHTPDLALRARCSEGGGLSLDLSGKRPTAIMRRPVRHERMIPDFRGPCLRFVFGSMGPLVSYLEENKTSLPSSCFCNETDNGRYGKCRKRCRLSARRHASCASWSMGAGVLTRTIVPVPLPPPPPLFRGHPFLSLSLTFKVFSLYRWQLCPAIAAPDDKRFLIIFLFLNGSFLD